MSTTRINPGKRMSSVVIHNRLIFLCGQVGEGATVSDQTRDCLVKIDALLAQAGSSRSHILQAIVWLRDIADFDAMNEVWDAWIPDGHAPARACGEARLAAPDLRLEIIITASVAGQARQDAASV
jgi:enamine deaminase RidA (YjgF/YER057c/UK114 family)